MTPEEKAEIKREIEEARRILREDHIIVSQKAIQEKLAKHFPDEPEPPDPTGPNPPKRKAEPNEPPKPKPNLWWGDALSE
jgi:hypothetical protein